MGLRPNASSRATAGPTLCLSNPNKPAARYCGGRGDFCPMTLKRTLPAALFAWFFLANPLFAADWLTFVHDPQRTGWAVNEVTLTPQNVNGLELKRGVLL